jgi:hypothetical protein
VGGEPGGDQEWGRIAAAVEFFGHEPGLPPVSHEGDEGTHGARTNRTGADKSQLVPTSSRVDGPPPAGLKAPDKQVMGASGSAPAAG